MKIKWISHACFQLVTNSGKVFYFDPYQIPDGLEPADVILASHDHYDHADKKSIIKVKQDSTTVICPKTCSKLISKHDAQGLDVNETVEAGGAKITAVPAYNVGKPFHPQGNKWLGYIVEVDGKKIYHAGDTDLIDEMKSLKDIDVALLPVGDNYTMGFKEGAEACKTINPKICVPMHDWDKDLNEFANIVKSTAPDVTVEILKGKDLSL